MNIKSLVRLFLLKEFVCYSKLGNTDTDCWIILRWEAKNIRVVRNARLDYDCILILYHNNDF